jgi:transglutaminase-like putative cysteine protease
MRLDLAFRLSTYVTLAFAAGCLAYAEDKYVPGVAWFGVAAGVALVVAYILEGRWTMPNSAANLLGGVIAVGTGAWVAVRAFAQPAEDSPLSSPWPAALLPYLGPLLMVLMIAKLVRPKRLTDYWGLQVIGLLQVGLAAALANDPQDSDLLFALMLGVYACLILWWALLCYLIREQGTVTTRVAPPRLTWRLLGVRQAASWLVAATVAGLLLFLLTPRLSSIQQPFVLNTPQKSSSTTGYVDTIDLNMTGQVEINNEIAFQVVASYDQVRPRERPDKPKLDLSSEQRWRGASLNYYDADKAVWSRSFPRRSNGVGNQIARGRGVQVTTGGPVLDVDAHFGGLVSIGPGQVLAWPHLELRRAQPRSLGPNRYYLNYTLYPRRTHGVFLAEPIILEGSARNVQTLMADPRDEVDGLMWSRDDDGTPKPILQPTGSVYYYRQATRPDGGQGLTPTRQTPETSYVRLIVGQQPVPGIGPWTAELLRQLAVERRYGLAEADLERDGAGLHPRNWEKAARALKAYLANSGDYRYTLDLRRQDLSLDPVEDFLKNVKQGHCERFATALTLMLRSQGIPARVVLGYQGFDAQGDGVYFVRQSNAHSWVEALIQRPGKGTTPEYYWLALDPTPPDTGEDSPARTLKDWWADCCRQVQAAWRDFVIGYNFETQSNLAADLRDSIRGNPLGMMSFGHLGEEHKLRNLSHPLWTILMVAGTGGFAVLAGVWLGRRRRRLLAPHMDRVPAVAFYARLLKLLAGELGLRPLASQTPLEFALAAGPAVAAASARPEWADLPARVVERLYPVRYGDQRLPEAEARALEGELDEVEAVLKDRPHGMA